ncbi:MAG: carboxypeptidase regulatory-like domain-containing protein [Planctomycetota bacterium]|nr:carboxypeptidase regulatory-like domain-containing protein [Planctomycetota bacterium]
MRSSWMWIVVALAGAGVAWMLLAEPENDAPRGTGYGGGPAIDEGPGEAPGLKGAGDPEVARLPAHVRGRGIVAGVVHRGGHPVAGHVELRHVQEIDPDAPFKGGVEMQFIARLLDAGMSSKAAVAQKRTGADGAFAFENLAPGLYEIRAEVDDGAVGLASATLPADGARVGVRVEVPEGDQALVGKISYADGKPFRGLVLAAQGNAFAMMMGGGAKGAPAHTDEQGRFRLGGLAAGSYQISALVPGVMRVMGAPITIPYAGEFTMVIDAAGAEVKGRVIDAETEVPISGATVFGGGGDPESSFAIHTTVTDADGLFSLTLPNTGRGGGMFARAPGYAAHTQDFRGGPPQDLVTVALLRLGSVAGRVTSKADGRPVAGVTVFSASGRGGFMGGAIATAITDADGRYVVTDVAPGAASLHAVGAGVVSIGLSGHVLMQAQTPYVVEVPPGKQATLDLEVGPAGTVAGRVLTEAGRPAEGVVVRASPPEMGPNMVAQMLGMGMSWGAAVTGPDGAFSLDLLVPGTEYVALAQVAGHSDAVSEKFIAAAGVTTTVELRVKAPRFVEVKVVDAATGQPIVGATVAATTKAAGRMIVDPDLAGLGGWTTGSSGVARAGPLADGDVTVAVSAAGYVAKGDNELAAGATGTLRIEMTRGLVLAGRVALPEGVPITATQLRIQRHGDGRKWYHKRTGVQADGTWRVDDLEEAGDYSLTADARWENRSFRGEVRASAGSEDVLIELVEDEKAASERFELLVVDVDDKPVPSARYMVSVRHGRGGSSSRGGQLNAGRAVVETGERGTGAELWVEVFSIIGGNGGATLVGPVGVVDGKVKVRLGTAHVIRGTVRDDAGAPVPGVRLGAQAQKEGKERFSNTAHGEAVSDGEGRFELKGLGDLPYRVTVNAPPDYAPVEAIDTRAGEKALAIRLVAGVRVTVTVLDAEGKPVAGAQVWAEEIKEGSGGRGWRGNNSTDSKGTLTLRGLRADVPHRLRAHPPNGRDDLKQSVLESWTPGDVTLRLDPAFTISGVVVDQAGQPAKEVTVRQRSQGTERWTGHHRTGADGEFRITGLDAGLYEVMAEGFDRGRGTTEAGVVRVRAGAKDVKLTVDIGVELMVTVRSGARAQGAQSAISLSTNGSSLSGEWLDDTRVRVRGARPDATYRLWISGLADGKYVDAEGILGGARTVEVDARAGGIIQGTLRWPAGTTFTYMGISANDAAGRQISAIVDRATGRFRLEGVPHDMEWFLNAYGMVESGKPWNAQAKARTGADVTLDLLQQR